MAEDKLKPKRWVTIKDVAAAAGVSPMTVSNVINKRHKFVSESTRKTVEREIARLNYRVQQNARGLRVSRRRAVGMIIVDETQSFLSDHFNSHIVAGLSNVLSQNDYALSIQGISLDHFEKSFAVQNFSVDGFCIILSGKAEDRRKVIDKLVEMNQPVVLFQEPQAESDADICIIRQDDALGGQTLADHFAARRRKHYLILRPATNWPAIEARIDSFTKQIMRLVPDATIDIIHSRTEEFDSVRDTLAEYLEDHDLPEAIFGVNDRLAIGAMALLQTRGIAIPEQVAIAGFNGFESRRYTQPLITTVISPAYALGETAGNVLLKRFSGDKFKEKEIVLPVYLEPGATT